MQCYTSNDKNETLPMPRKCNDTAPMQVSTYCDGSVRNPGGDVWKIRRIGIWWPEGSRKDENLNKDEARFLHVEEKIEGVQGWNAMNSLRGISTRTEIGAVIVATLADQAIHAGIDNQGVVNGLLRRKAKLRRHPNGDLWALLYQVMDQKRLQLTPQKVKSHVKTAEQWNK